MRPPESSAFAAFWCPKIVSRTGRSATASICPSTRPSSSVWRRPRSRAAAPPTFRRRRDHLGHAMKPSWWATIWSGQAALDVVLAGAGAGDAAAGTLQSGPGQDGLGAEEPQPAKKPAGQSCGRSSPPRAAQTAADGRESPVVLGARRRRPTGRDGRSHRPIALRLVVGRPPLSGRRSGFLVGDARGARQRVVARIAQRSDAGRRSRDAGGERAGGRRGAPVAHRVGRPPSLPPAHPSGRRGQPSSATGPVAGVADVRFLAPRRGSLGPVADFRSTTSRSSR